MSFGCRIATLRGRRLGALSTVVVLLVFAGCLAASASAGPYFDRSSPPVPRPGQVVTFHGGAGIRFRVPLPLYLVPIERAPRPYPCLYHGKQAGCEPTAMTAPKERPYIRIGSLDLLHAKGNPGTGYDVAVKFRVPTNLSPGDYAYVIYCVPCQPKGKGGSLIAFTDYLRPGGWRDTSLVRAGPALRVI